MCCEHICDVILFLAQALACSSYDSESIFAFLASFSIMSAERLLWLAGEIHKGRSAFVSFSYNSQLRREKIKFTLGDYDLDAAVHRPCIFAALSTIQLALSSSTIVDKGHKSHRSSRSVVEFWIQQPDTTHEAVPPKGRRQRVGKLHDQRVAKRVRIENEIASPVKGLLDDLDVRFAPVAEGIQNDLGELSKMCSQVATIRDLSETSDVKYDSKSMHQGLSDVKNKISIRISELRACREAFFKDMRESILPHFPTDKVTIEASDTKWTKICHEFAQQVLDDEPP